jgi:hypothetical protein
MICPIVNFPFFSCVATFQHHLHMGYTCHLVRYSNACGSYHDSLDRRGHNQFITSKVAIMILF